ncbi:MAG: hypothetical protein ACRDZ4_20225 [Egibacteraceae bacterium]
MQSRQLSDWVRLLATATPETITGAFEAMLLEARATVEGGGTVADDEARRVGEAAGQRLWTWAKHARSLDDQSHLRHLEAMRVLLRAISRGAATGRHAGDPTNRSARVSAVFDVIEFAFHSAARGAADLTFSAGRTAGREVLRVLLTGFDPFEPSGTLAPAQAGEWNPSGAAVIALDNTPVPIQAAGGRPATAAIEGVVLPVSYTEFDTGLVERIVRSRLGQLDAAITVSMNGRIVDANAAVRIERYAVGVRDTGQPVPAAGLEPLGAPILEARGPIQEIAQATGRPARGRRPAIPTPTIGEEITFRFASPAIANAASRTLGLAPQNRRDVAISDEQALHRILSTMRREANGLDLTFEAGGRSFTARVLQGPGGAFLSNEVSYRMLRMLQSAGGGPSVSFHVHTPSGTRLPQDTSTPEARRVRAEAVRDATGLRDRVVETLRRVVAATCASILGSRRTRGGRP